MKHRISAAVLMLPACLVLLLSGCSSVKVWPFDDATPSGQAQGPANATEYQCEGGKRFFVRYMDNGATAWLIYPDREVSLAKAATTSGTRYTNGVAVLTINENVAALTDGPAINYSGCKVAGK